MLGMVLILFLVQISRGSGKDPSIIDSTRCTAMDWSLFVILLIASLIMTLIAVIVQRKEYCLKRQIGYKFVTGDFQCTLKNVIGLPFAACCIGFITALSGFGTSPMIIAILL